MKWLIPWEFGSKWERLLFGLGGLVLLRVAFVSLFYDFLLNQRVVISVATIFLSCSLL